LSYDDCRNKKKFRPIELVIIGGGYAGLAALITLGKQAPDAEITLVDPHPCHLCGYIGDLKWQ
jgi:hypothetical protein